MSNALLSLPVLVAVATVVGERLSEFRRDLILTTRSDDAGSVGAFSSFVDGGDVELCYRFGAWL